MEICADDTGRSDAFATMCVCDKSRDTMGSARTGNNEDNGRIASDRTACNELREEEEDDEDDDTGDVAGLWLGALLDGVSGEGKCEGVTVQ